MPAISRTFQPGETFTFSRTFTRGDILAFAEVSGDHGDHHVHPDAEGRLMAHGLLTATLPTRLGGDISYVAADMVFRFFRPVFSGDTVTVVVTLDTVEQVAGRQQMEISWEATNQHGRTVMTGQSSGFAPAAI